MAPFLVGVLETHRHDLFAGFESAHEFGDGVSCGGCLFEIRPVSVVEPEFIPGGVVRAFVAQPLSLEVSWRRSNSSNSSGGGPSAGWFSSTVDLNHSVG